jgi:hypothetical protein
MPQPDHIAFSWDEATPEVDLGGGVRVPPAFRAHLFYSRLGGEVYIDVAVEGGRARVAAVHMSESPGVGITGVSIEQVSIRRVLDSAVQAMSFYAAWLSGRAPGTDVAAYLSGRAPGAGAVVAVRAATRKRVSDDRLARVLEAAESGGVDAVMEQESVGERQAFRLIKRAKEGQR